MPAKQQPTKDPTTDEALLGLDPTYAGGPDMPVQVAKLELASLARMAKSKAPAFAKVGISASTIDAMAQFARRLGQLDSAWNDARNGVKLTAGERKLLKEAEALDSKLLAGGRWALRNDAAAQTTLDRIAEGSGLIDTVQDLKDLVAFWAEHRAERSHTAITDKDLSRATALANTLEPVAQKEANDLDAAAAIDLRNRCFWAADTLAKEIREGGRYAFTLQPTIARKFASRYRTSSVRRSKLKARAKKAATPTTLPAASTTA